MKTICILNPAAGRGSAPNRWNKSRQYLNSQGVKTETFITSGPGDAARLAEQALSRGAHTIIVAGGDGTISEVAGAAAGSEAKIAVAPFGTGNDFAKGMGIPERGVDWVRDFNSFTTRKLDLGVLNGRYFVNQAGFGFDARVGNRVNTGIGFLTGKPAYLAAVVSCLWDLKAVETEISIDGTTLQKKVVLITFANSMFVGGGLKLAPTAVPDDGFLDLVIIEEISRLELLKSLPMIFNGSHFKHPAVTMLRGRRFCLSSQEPEYVHTDGEIHQTDHMEVTIRPQSLNLLLAP